MGNDNMTTNEFNNYDEIGMIGEEHIMRKVDTVDISNMTDEEVEDLMNTAEMDEEDPTMTKEEFTKEVETGSTETETKDVGDMTIDEVGKKLSESLGGLLDGVDLSGFHPEKYIRCEAGVDENGPHFHLALDTDGFVGAGSKSDEDDVSHPSHYCREGAMECIDEMLLVFTKFQVEQFCLMTAWKYRYRAGSKGNYKKDMAKSDWYMAKAKQLRDELDEEKKARDERMVAMNGRYRWGD